MADVVLSVGDLVEDVVVRVTADRPRWGTDTAAEIHHRRGGSAANVAVAVAGLGGRARFVGRVGDDAGGRWLVDELVGVGVDARVQVGGRTGTIVVVVDASGERTMLPDRGASLDLVAVDPAVLDDVGAVHVPLYSLVGDPLAGSTTALVRAARERRALVSVDASSRGLIEDLGIERARRLIAGLEPDVVFANADEAAALGLPAAPLAPLVVVKRGADDVVVTDARSSTSTAVPVPPVDDVVDTTGAGDAFAAGWLVSRVAGADAVAATRAGIAAAARTLGVTGAGFAPAAGSVPAEPRSGRSSARSTIG